MNELINPHDGQSTDEARQQMNNLLKDQEKASQFATDLADQKQQIKEMLGDDDVISLSTAYEDKIKL
jgi:polyhydroxyalkanoate synthesis regulator phasin